MSWYNSTSGDLMYTTYEFGGGTPPANKGLIPMDSGTPFYTNVTNPYNLNLNKDDCENITWWVNATGDVNTTYIFFVYANQTSNMAVSNITNNWEVSII